MEKNEFILPYEFVRKQDNPEATLLEFCESSYRAGFKLANWDAETLEHKPPLKKPKQKYVNPNQMVLDLQENIKKILREN